MSRLPEEEPRVERASPLEEAASPALAAKAAGVASPAGAAVAVAVAVAVAAEPLWAGEAEDSAGSPSGPSQAVTGR
jgi:hypothetical protein